VIIGKKGADIEQLRKDLSAKAGGEVALNIVEIRKPELSAQIVGETIAKQIEARINYRKAIKMAIQSTMRASGEGIKVRISGRLNGSDMSRSEEYKEGRSPLHTFRADIDYAVVEAQTVYGKIGLKIWICRGEVYEKVDLFPTQQGTNASSMASSTSGSGGQNRDNKRNSGGKDNRREKRKKKS
jgi:small subunit ribosomal protein S3